MVRVANVTVWSVIALLLMSVLLTGCAEQQWRELARPSVEIPAANVPLALRQKNWPDARGSGSCVIASTCSALQWHNKPELAERFRKSYAGGQTESSIKQKWTANGIKFVAPERDHDYGDPEFLEWAKARSWLKSPRRSRLRSLAGSMTKSSAKMFLYSMPSPSTLHPCRMC